MFSLNCLAVLGCKCQEDEVFCFIKRFGPLSNGWTYGFLGCRIVLATLFIVVGNGFLVAFGNHESRSKSCISLSPKFLVPELLSMWRICCVSSVLETSLLFYGHFHKLICSSMCWFSRLHTWKTLGKLYGNCISCLLCDPAHSGCWSSYCVQVSMSMLSKIKAFCVSALIWACPNILVLYSSHAWPFFPNLTGVEGSWLQFVVRIL